MGMLGRIIALLRALLRKRRNAREDPNDALDRSYETMLTDLQETRRHLAEAMAQQKRLERQIAQGDAETHATQQAALDALLPQIDRLKRALQELAARIDHFRTQKEALRIGTAAAEAHVKATETLTGIGNELGANSETYRRAEGKMLDAQARAGAMDRLIRDGVLNDPFGDSPALPDPTGNDRAERKTELTSPKVATPPSRREDKENG